MTEEQWAIIEELRRKVANHDDALIQGAQQFTLVAKSLDEIKDHLKKQDQDIATTNAGVSGITEMWESGIKGVKFACRVVKGWDWLIAQTLSKRGITLLALGLIVYRVLFNNFPAWTAYIVLLIKYIEGVSL